ncbi:MAG: acyltransferase [Lachnospiraceae bacterium]|nr:acyltransferase [Lachnospiraceae bacterium]
MELSKYRSQIYGFSILWIMLFHAKAMLGLRYDNFSEMLWWLDSIMKHGNTGVDVFLFMSGVCLFFSFSRNQDMALYYKKRMQRLFIPVLVIDGWYWAVFTLILGTGIWGFVSRISLACFWITGDQQIWYVSLILVLYLLYPFFYAVIFSGKETHAWLRTVLLTAAVLLVIHSFRMSSPRLFNVYEIALCRFPVFIAGTFAGRYVSSGKKMPGGIYIAAAAVMAAAVALKCAGLIDSLMIRYWGSIIGLSAMVLLVFVLKPVSNPVPHRFLSYFGERSLELYLAHVMITRFYKNNLPALSSKPRLLEYLVILIISAGVAEIAHRICGAVSARLSKTAA